MAPVLRVRTRGAESAGHAAASDVRELDAPTQCVDLTPTVTEQPTASRVEPVHALALGLGVVLTRLAEPAGRPSSLPVAAQHAPTRDEVGTVAAAPVAGGPAEHRAPAALVPPFPVEDVTDLAEPRTTSLPLDLGVETRQIVLHPLA